MVAMRDDMMALAEEPAKKCAKTAAAGTPEEVLTLANIANAVLQAVQDQEVIDVHTHLLPPTHGKLMLWGIDELLTYHYLISEYFMVAPGDMTHEKFFAQSKKEQAEQVWNGLFVERSP